jgi:hypothetical protein
MAREPGVLDQLKALDEQRAKLLEGAKNAALEKAKEAIEELNALGFRYRLAEGPALARVLRAKTEGETPNHKPKDADCPICNFRTKPPHDRRSHRNQERKKPFTAKELEERGLVRV